MTRLGCDIKTCGSRWFVRTYTDGPTGASYRACWRRAHRAMARTALARRAAVLAGARDRQGPARREGDGA